LSESGPLRTAPDGVTIAIPSWNHEYLLSRSVGSAIRALRALREHGADGEVLVVDDGSRDGSATLLRQFEALYFEDGLRLLLLAKNGGLPALTRNHALARGRYRYVLFLDADNELVSENLWHFYRSIKQTGAAVIYGSLLGMGDDSERCRMISNESYQDRIIEQNYIDAMALIDRLQITDAGGILDDELMIAREDWELYMHLAAVGRRLVFVPLIMGLYYDLPGSMTNQSTDVALHEKQFGWVQRVYDQLGIRQKQPLNTRYLRYHPDVGYL
jgi:glycosyltransferase involved in cell wall biosynthesis